ncbi:hypothetical protein EDF60_0619 [Leucobacter luti]|nr:hypothetical protein [Leucobacter luti]TCK45392.1 hypothetical protein EDF60_0619 [Leucobacter luti]
MHAGVAGEPDTWDELVRTGNRVVRPRFRSAGVNTLDAPLRPLRDISALRHCGTAALRHCGTIA